MSLDLLLILKNLLFKADLLFQIQISKKNVAAVKAFQFNKWDYIKYIMNNTLDQFYTNEAVALKYYNILKQKVEIHSCDIFLEPSAGQG